MLGVIRMNKSICLTPFLNMPKRASAAFDAPIVGIRPTAARFDQFNGINVSGRNYINLNANVSFINGTGYEIYHDIERTRPDLHA
jgi:hypothetical protein